MPNILHTMRAVVDALRAARANASYFEGGDIHLNLDAKWMEQAEEALRAIDEIDPSKLHVIMHGNPVDGVTLEGPYASHADALAAGDTVDTEWWVVPLTSPEEE